MKRGFAVVTISALVSMSLPTIYSVPIVTMAAAATSTTPSQPTAVSSTYTVQSGDTLWKIAGSTGVSVALLERYNGITNANSLKVGQVLRIPVTYVVKSGDTLGKIAATTGSTVPAVVQANSITNANAIQVGTTLIIPQNDSTYTVKAGDTFWKIAQTTGASVQAIQQVNPSVNPSNLSVGQVLQIPVSTASSTATSTLSSGTGTGITPTGAISSGQAPASPVTSASPSPSYTVQSGDTMWKIAQVNGITLAALEQANPQVNPSSLTVGQVLQLPSATSVTGTTSSAGSTDTAATSTGSTGSSSAAAGTTGTSTASATPAVASVTLSTTGNPSYVSSKVNQTLPLVLTAKDAAGNAVAVAPNGVTYTITGANPGTNPANGSVTSATQQFVATQPGIYNIVATVGGVQSQPLDVQVFGNPSTLDVSVNPTLVTGSYTYVPVRYTVVDSMGQPIMDTPVTISLDNGAIAGISLTNSGPITNLPASVTVNSGNGGGTVWLRAGNTAGSANLTVSCGGLTKTVKIVSTSGPAKITATVAKSSLVANTPSSDLVTVQAFNADGTPDAGVPLTTDYPTSVFTADSNQVTTNSQGIAQFNVYEKGNSTGTYSVGARTTGAGADSIVTVVPGADAAHSSAQMRTAMGGGQPYVVPMTIQDANGSPVLHLKASAFNVQLQGPASLYNVQGTVSEIGNGQYQVTFMPNDSGYGDVNLTPGTYQAYAMVNGVTVGEQTVSLTNVSYPALPAEPVSAPNISMSYPQKLVAGTPSGSIYAVQIHVTDANGNPVANQKVTLATENTNIASPALQVVTTDANGFAGVGMDAGSLPGVTNLVAVSGSTKTTLQIQTVTRPTSLVVTVPSTNVVENSATGTTATVTVQNADGTPASGIALNVWASSNNNGLALPQTNIVTDANGQATFTVPTSISYGNTITVQVGDITMESNSVTLNLVSGVDAAKSNVTSFPTSLNVGSPFTVNVHVSDVNGNAMTGLANTAFVLSAGPGYSYQAKTATDLGDGNYSVTFDTTGMDLVPAGNQTLSFETNGATITSQTVNVTQL